MIDSATSLRYAKNDEKGCVLRVVAGFRLLTWNY